MIRIPRRLVMWGGAAVVASAGFAFMATNSVDASNAGTGPGVVSGYHVTAISYHLIPQPNVPGGSYIDSVSFKLDPDNALKSNMDVWFEDDGLYVSGIYTDCNEAQGTWTCDTNNMTDISTNTLNGGTYGPAATGDAATLYVSAAQ